MDFDNRERWNTVVDIARSSRFAGNDSQSFDMNKRSIPQVQNSFTRNKTWSANIARTMFKDVVNVGMSRSEDDSRTVNISIQTENVNASVKDLRGRVQIQIDVILASDFVISFNAGDDTLGKRQININLISINI